MPNEHPSLTNATPEQRKLVADRIAERDALDYCNQGHPGVPAGTACGPCDDEAAAGYRRLGHDVDRLDLELLEREAYSVTADELVQLAGVEREEAEHAKRVAREVPREGEPGGAS